MARKKKKIDINQEQLFDEYVDLESIYASSVKKYISSNHSNNDWDYDSDSYGNHEW
jgi:hypothetical protein